jgi:hypothetical protein
MNSLDLYDVINNGYKNRDHQVEAFKNNGYNYDNQLSNHNHQVYHNPTDNKLLFNVAGTHNFNDIGTDLYLASGHLKNTNRYKHADEALKKAKKKYLPVNSVITGHSLGGSIASGIGGKSDKIITYNKGNTIGQKTRANEKSIRIDGDIVSVLGNNQKTLPKKKSILPFIPTARSIIMDGIYSHKSSNLKNKKIFI